MKMRGLCNDSYIRQCHKILFFKQMNRNMANKQLLNIKGIPLLVEMDENHDYRVFRVMSSRSSHYLNEDVVQVPFFRTRLSNKKVSSVIALNNNSDHREKFLVGHMCSVIAVCYNISNEKDRAALKAAFFFHKSK